jgi:hypothetical protein
MDEQQHSVLTVILGGGRGTRLFPPYAPGYAWVPLDNMPLCCNGHTLLFACIVVIEYVDRRGRQLL